MKSAARVRNTLILLRRQSLSKMLRCSPLIQLNFLVETWLYHSLVPTHKSFISSKRKLAMRGQEMFNLFSPFLQISGSYQPASNMSNTKTSCPPLHKTNANKAQTRLQCEMDWAQQSIAWQQGCKSTSEKAALAANSGRRNQSDQ